MAFFKSIKTNIGVEEDSEKKHDKKEEKRQDKHKEKETKDEKKPQKDWMQSKGQLAADIYETKDDFCVCSPIAGVNQEEIDIFVENDMLIIKGERPEPDTATEKKHYFKECYWGPFSRQIILPEDLNLQKIKASLKKGVLLVSIPKKKAEKKKIEIEIGE